MVWLTFESPQHGLQVGMSDGRGGSFEGEGLLQPVEQGNGHLHCQATGPPGQNHHSMHQGALVDYGRKKQNTNP